MISDQAQWTINLVKWIGGGNLSFMDMIKDEGVIEGIVGYLDKQVPHEDIVKKQQREIERLKKRLQKKEDASSIKTPVKIFKKIPAKKEIVEKPSKKIPVVNPTSRKRKHYSKEDKIKILKDIQFMSKEDREAYLIEHNISRSNIPKWKKAFPDSPELSIDIPKEPPSLKPSIDISKEVPPKKTIFGKKTSVKKPVKETPVKEPPAKEVPKPSRPQREKPKKIIFPKPPKIPYMLKKSKKSLNVSIKNLDINKDVILYITGFLSGSDYRKKHKDLDMLKYNLTSLTHIWRTVISIARDGSPEEQNIYNIDWQAIKEKFKNHNLDMDDSLIPELHKYCKFITHMRLRAVTNISQKELTSALLYQAIKTIYMVNMRNTEGVDILKLAKNSINNHAKYILNWSKPVISENVCSLCNKPLRQLSKITLHCSHCTINNYLNSLKANYEQKTI